MGRRLALQPLPHRAGDEPEERLTELIRAEVSECGFAEQRCGEPVVHVRGERRQRKVWPFVAFGGAQEITRSRHCASALVQGRRSSPASARPRANLLAAASSAATGIGCSCKAMAPSPRMRRPRKARLRRIERRVLTRLDLVRELRLDLGGRDRRRQHDAAAGGAAGNLGHGEERFTG